MGETDPSALPTVLVDGRPFHVDIRMFPLARHHRLLARQVLNDAYRALELLEAQKGLIEARIHYFGLVALLRAVGHVLDKVDASQDGNLRRVVDRKHQEVKQNREAYPIFHEFIDAERNLILKEYRSSAEVQVPVPVLIDAEGNEFIQKDEAAFFPMFVIKDGTFDGHDARDVAACAIAYWDTYLGEIENECFGESFAQNFPTIRQGITLSDSV
jgi:hypothetical protein